MVLKGFFFLLKKKVRSKKKKVLKGLKGLKGSAGKPGNLLDDVTIMI